MSTTLPTKQATGFTGKGLEINLTQSDTQASQARIIILYGDSGLGKSTNAKFFAMKMFERTGKPIFLVSAEDSSKSIFDPLVKAGIVKAIYISKLKQPLVFVRKIVDGNWPEFDESGKLTGWRKIGKEEFSAGIFEGLTTIGEQLQEDARENHRFLREQKSDAFEIGDEKFAIASQTATYFVQLEMLRAVKATGMLPVERILWTAHEGKGVEDGVPIRGPQIVGSAATDKVKKYCGTLLHIDGVKDAKTGKVTPRIYYDRHADPVLSSIFYPAKVTMPSEKKAELEKAFPGGFFDPGLVYGTGLDKFLDVEESLVSTFGDELTKWKEDVLAKKAA